MKIKEAAKRLQKSEQFVRLGLQRGQLPFGTAVKMGAKRWNYHISDKLFNDYLGENNE
jgi:transposase